MRVRPWWVILSGLVLLLSVAAWIGIRAVGDPGVSAVFSGP